MQDIVVFSHLRWDFVYQRPQHLLSRLAHRRRIFVIEEPVPDADGPPRFERSEPCEGVVVLRPRTPVHAPGFDDAQHPVLRTLLDGMINAERIVRPIVWFYTPLALPLLEMFDASALVYDCMDELAAFDFAPPLLVERERALLAAADVVFTGGPSLYAAKRLQNANVHCFPSAVEAEHFAPGAEARDPAAAARAEALQAGIGRPRLGFFGVVDERLDAHLLRAIAEAEPDWQIVMVGPVVKVDPVSLPRLSNVHWLGQQPYALLPHLVAQWDVCLLPFALNAATRFISPTKTLEYMAAEKPIVGTPIRDVAALYGDSVRIAADAATFVEACRAAMAEDEAARRRRIETMRAQVSESSWDATGAAIESLIEKALAARPSAARIGAATLLQARPANDPVANAAPAPAPRPEPLAVPMPGEAVDVIVGAGPTGLAAAYYLGLEADAARTVLIEREKRVGGWCRSVEDHGFTFDFAGHIMFSNDEEVLRLYEVLLGENLHWQNREAWIHSQGVDTRYPFQGALYGLPPKVLKECLVGAIEARFGPLKGGPGDAPAAAQKPPANFEEFIYRTWGKGVAKHFAVPYNEKLWAVPLAEMETSWLGGRVPLPDLEQMIEGALEPVPAPMGPNARFGYPLKGGFQALMDGFLPLLDAELALDTSVVAVSPSRRLVRTDDGRTLRWRTLVSTMPLPALVRACGDEAPAAIREAAGALRHVSVRCVNLGVAREAITDKHWIYYPEDTVFHRIFVQGNASPHCNPPGGFGLTCEITYAPGKPLPADGQALIDLCVADCRRVGMLRGDDRLITANQVDMPCAYVVYDHGRAAHVERIRAWLADYDIVLAGRYSEWEYYNSDHAFLAGRKAAEACIKRRAASKQAAVA